MEPGSGDGLMAATASHAGTGPDGAGWPRVAVLLSTWNGERFLQAQLDSIVAQAGAAWTLYWRDDGSADGTCALMRAFVAGPGRGRCVDLCDGRGRLGATASFLGLLRAVPRGEVVAFADQDDVWLPGKLARGLAALAGAGEAATLYCARQVLVDAQLRRVGLSFQVRRTPGFPAALIQNVATGCTVMLSPAAVALVARSEAPAATVHDWWCYVVVAAGGGRLLMDDEPVVLYRQHERNAVGAPASLRRRAVGALRRGPGVFMQVFRGHVAALRAQPWLLTPASAGQLAVLAQALEGGAVARLRAMRLPGLRRQTWQESVLFRWWFLIG